MEQKYKRYDKVTCNGNPEGTVMGYYDIGIVEVRLMSGTRYIGDVVVCESNLDLENKVLKPSNSEELE